MLEFVKGWNKRYETDFELHIADLKNSSLAIAIGYPDFVSVANTSLNQTGQAIELVGLIMAVYLSFSLLTSLFMNWYNKKKALIGGQA